ncbi:MAG: hypothetical protein P5702_17030 [Limnospira sp. PMC 1291.21]|uniref:Uncharacterized protein n=3 Tax=Limnospira TaxID=2596745 RepID=A0A9P1KHX7_9CYAN|nr:MULTISPECIES: hypothetical protein [Limnospira]EKD07859.1 hypothetical protein SPLC1_S361110 [Arthrospira platensis C1]MDC0836112.1 hypothetical protein [Limnoraphis robusta]MDY7054871.1 hypothetical protein [Limnospira fusiformis LS22]QJB25545.1 hypothetical protein HFV01_06770 [Limnospira fusiformis SAG 85.79]EDZ96331.1 conserved hypothetical protein [Limnospira maxima CS-328]
MDSTTIWELGSSNPDNANNLEVIRQWWANLQNIKIDWQQRLMPQDTDPSQLNWEPQKFDENFVICNPEIRGITIFWSKPNNPDQRSITPRKMVLYLDHQQLYIFSQSQQQLVLKVSIPELKYDTINIENPHIAVGNNGLMILFRDPAQLLDVKVILTPEKLQQLKQKLI